MPNTIKSILFFLLLLLTQRGVGQIFPVQVTTQLGRPYSLYLSDYTAPGSDRIKVNIFLTDISRTDLNIRLRLRIEGQGIKIETKPEFVPPVLTVHGDTPLELNSSELADYFDPRNLNFTGISQREYEQRGALPEGYYQFCFEVYEYNRNVKISNSSCASAWLILNDPPIINLPRDNEKIRIQSPQQVIFQWTPRHTGSPNAAFTTEYDFKLVEIWPSTRNPNDAILTSPPIYETTTTSTTLIYGPAETPLEPGRHYAFQIKARSMAGVDELNLFKNNGLSQVSSFVFGDACLPPLNIIADATGTTKFTAKWDEGLGQTAYNLRYRLAEGGGEWYTNNTINSDVEIKSLQPNTRYEYQVSATCGLLESTFSPIATVTTKPNPPIVYSCGVPLNPFNLDPSQLLDVLKVGDVIQAGDFDVTVTKATGGSGNFSGEGVIQVSYFNQAKVKAEFSGITVNKDMRMVNGYMNVTGAGVDVIPSGVLDFMDKLSESLAFLDSALDKYEENLPKRFDPTVFIAEKTIVIPGTIVSVAPATDGSGGVVVVDDKGNKQTIPAGTSAAITDSKGKGYLVDKQGGIHETTAAIAAKAGKREYNLTLKFTAVANQTFGFDELGTKSALAATYDKIDGKYDVAWKSVAAGQTDKVQAILEGTGIDKSKVHFEQFGQALVPDASGTNNTFSLSVQGKTDGVTEGLVALYTPADTTKKEQVLGQLNVVTYNEIPKTVVIVPVNDSDGNKLKKVGDKIALQNELNKIYGQAVVKWQVNFADNISVPGIEPFEDGGSGLLSNYTSHMRQVISAYKSNMQPNTYYLFLVSNPKESSTLGVMPRSKESGFIFVDKHADAAALARTIAHELGHGAFNLHHTFMEPKLTQTKGSTDNLMDYPAGDKLYKYQWDKMRYPDIVMGLFEDDEEAMSQLENYSLVPEMKETRCRITPDGRLFDITSLGEYTTCSIYNNVDYAVQALFKSIRSTTGELLGYEDVVYKFKVSNDGFGKYYPYNSKTQKFVDKGQPLDIKIISEGCETILAKIIANDPCGFISIRKPDINNIKNFITIKGSPTPLVGNQLVDFVNKQITSDAVQYREGLSLTTDEKISRNCIYSLGEQECYGVNIAELGTQKTEIESLVSIKDIDAIADKINATSVCIIMEVSYEKIEKLIDILSSESAISAKREQAILKLLQGIHSDKYGVFINHLRGENSSYEKARHLIKEISGDEYNLFIEMISRIVAGISNNDQLKWDLVNVLIHERYGSLKDQEKAGLAKMFSSMDEYKKNFDKLSQVTDIFFDMLLKDFKNIQNFKNIYEVAIIRQSFPEAFGNFTQTEVKFSNSTNIFCRTVMKSKFPSSVELNWMRPVACIIETENCPGPKNIQEWSEDQLADHFEWSKYLKNNKAVSELYDNDDTKLLCVDKFKEQFILFIEKKKQDSDSFWKNYALSKECSSLNPAIEQIQAYENATTLKKVDKQLRLNLVKAMFLCGTSLNQQFWQLEYSENVLMKLLVSFEKSDPLIVTTLENVGIDNVCKQLVGDQFTKVSLWLAAQLQSSKSTKPLSINNVLDSEEKIKSLFDASGDFIGGNQILQMEADMFQWKNFSGRFDSKTSINTDIGKFEYNQEVLVYVAGDFEFLGQQIRKGSIIQMPLIQAYAMSESNRSIVLEKSLWTAFDIGTLVIGLGEVKIFFKAGQLLTKAIVLTDIAASTAGTIVNALNENYISPQLRSRIQLLSLVGSAPQMLRSIGKIDRLVKQADEALAELTGLKNVNKASENFLSVKKYVETIRDRVRQVAATTASFDDLLKLMANEKDFLKNFNSLSDELKAIFKSDFGQASDDILNELKKSNSEFFEGWVKYRTNNPLAAICNN